MPCRGPDDEMPRSYYEEETSKLLAMIEELNTGKLPSYYGNRFYFKVFCRSRYETFDSNIKVLCYQIRMRGGRKALVGLSQHIRDWWENHNKYDIQRETFKLERLKAEIEELENKLEKTKEELKQTEIELETLKTL